MFIVSVVSVFIAALTFLFGSGVVSQFQALNSTTSIVGEITETTEHGTEKVEVIGESIDSSIQLDKLGTVQEINGSYIHIESVTFVDDGFCYEYPSTNKFINMEKLVLIGKFMYSKELNEVEKKNWRHGGELFNSDGISCYSDKTSFWSDYESLQFAIDLPEEIEPGKYSCVLYHYINDQMFTTNIEFEIY